MISSSSLISWNEERDRVSEAGWHGWSITTDYYFFFQEHSWFNHSSKRNTLQYFCCGGAGQWATRVGPYHWEKAKLMLFIDNLNTSLFLWTLQSTSSVQDIHHSYPYYGKVHCRVHFIVDFGGGKKERLFFCTLVTINVTVFKWRKQKIFINHDVNHVHENKIIWMIMSTICMKKNHSQIAVFCKQC